MIRIEMLKGGSFFVFLMCMRLFFILALIFCFSSCSRFSKLSKYEKRWALFHPFAALKVKQLSKTILSIYDEVKRSGQLDNYENGGKLDAFRHVFSTTCLCTKINPRKIKKLGEAHEKGNYRDFLKSRMEEGELPDSMGTVMDLKNNELGISIGQRLKGRKLSITEVKNEVINSIRQGNAFYLKRNSSGVYLDCLNRTIDLSAWRSKWGIPKCLISTKE